MMILLVVCGCFFGMGSSEKGWALGGVRFRRPLWAKRMPHFPSSFPSPPAREQAVAGMTAVRLFGFIAILYQMSSETVDSDVRPT